jgi:hypothetical protein
MNHQLLTIEVLSGNGASEAAALDRVVGGTIDLNEAKRIGHRLFAITEGSPKTFRIVSSSRQLLCEWHVGDEPKH